MWTVFLIFKNTKSVWSWKFIVITSQMSNIETVSTHSDLLHKICKMVQLCAATYTTLLTENGADIYLRRLLFMIYIYVYLNFYFC